METMIFLVDKVGEVRATVSGRCNHDAGSNATISQGVSDSGIQIGECGA